MERPDHYATWQTLKSAELHYAKGTNALAIGLTNGRWRTVINCRQ